MQPHLRGVIVLAWAPIALLAALVFVGVFALVGIPFWIGLLIGPALAAGVIWWVLRNSVDRLLVVLGARALTDLEYPQYDNIVEGLALSTGLVEPELYVIDDSSLNAVSLDWAGDRAVAITTGLLDACGRIELEGVIAGLLVRLKQGDAERATLGATLFGRPIIDSSIASIASPLAHLAFGRLFDADREIAGDQGAVSVTRYPPGLSAALARIEVGPYEPKRTSPGLQHLWFAPPRPDAAVPHTPINWRLDVLSEI
jgi:Zn-dependent protease with chaperone function